ncbi:MAG: hypothetical protein ISQ13_02040 [Candidatus Margulisbacteria bacterium]|nr:hypothetical protein [Candidatus Margulisiibacteriota bacterium]
MMMPKITHLGVPIKQKNKRIVNQFAFFCRYLFSIGVETTTPIEQKKSIALTNGLAIFGFSLGIFYAIFFFVQHYLLIAFLAMLVSLLYATALVCNAIKKHILASFLVLFTACSSILIFNILLQQVFVNTQMMLSILVLAFIIFSNEKWPYRLISCGIPIITYSIMYFSKLPMLNTTFFIDQKTLNIFKFLLNYTGFIIAIIALLIHETIAHFYARKNQLLLQKSLRDNKRIKLAHEKETASIKKIQELNKELILSDMNAIKKTVATISHNIGNDLVPIINYARAIDQKSQNKEIKDFSNVIHDKGQKIAELIKKLSKIKKIKTESMDHITLIDLDQSMYED